MFEVDVGFCPVAAEGYGRLLSSLYGGITGGSMAFGQKSSNTIGNLPWSVSDALGNSLRGRPLGVWRAVARLGSMDVDQGIRSWF